jgi:hypothetical protein
MKPTVPHGAHLQGGGGYDLGNSQGVDPLGGKVASHFRSGVQVNLVVNISMNLPVFSVRDFGYFRYCQTACPTISFCVGKLQSLESRDGHVSVICVIFGVALL